MGKIRSQEGDRPHVLGHPKNTWTHGKRLACPKYFQDCVWHCPNYDAASTRDLIRVLVLCTCASLKSDFRAKENQNKQWKNEKHPHKSLTLNCECSSLLEYQTNINRTRPSKTYQDPTYSPPTSQLSQSLSGKTPATPKGSRARPANQANTTGSNLRLPRLSRAFLGINATSSAMSQLSVSCKKSQRVIWKGALY